MNNRNKLDVFRFIDTILKIASGTPKKKFIYAISYMITSALLMIAVFFLSKLLFPSTGEPLSSLIATILVATFVIAILISLVAFLVYAITNLIASPIALGLNSKDANTTPEEKKANKKYLIMAIVFSFVQLGIIVGGVVFTALNLK